MNTNIKENLIIVGDLVPVKEDENNFISGNIENNIDNEILDYFQSAKYRVCNLEAPITLANSRIKKCGPNLKINPDCMCGLKKINIDVFTLANNHILDYGEKGLRDTLNILKDNGIMHCGAGNNIAGASKPVFLSIGEKRVGIFCCSENEFSIATDKTPGAYGFDPLYTLDLISEIKAMCDYLIILHHGGKEFYRYPSPNLEKTCMRMVDKGANLVICQHSHCIGCETYYKEAKIIYGQGNFLFNRKHDEFWDSGLIINVSFDKKNINVEAIPIVNTLGKIEFAKYDTKKKIMDKYKERSNQVENKDFIYNNFISFTRTKRDEYYKALLGVNTIDAYIYRLLNRLFPYKKNENIFFKPKVKKELINYVLCEAHREVLLTILNDGE